MDTMLDAFIENLEETFGKYRSGMVYSIRQKLVNINQNGLDILTDCLTREYDMARPPSLKVILSTIHNHNIKGAIQNQYICSVCEHCGMEFSGNSYKCPHCKNIRKYGVVKILKDKPVWHDAEIRQIRKDELQLEDEKRKLIK